MKKTQVRRKGRSVKAGSCASAALLWAVPAVAMAQQVSAQSPQPAPSAQPAQKNDALPEIVVTAERRVENLQDVPIAATSIGGDQLQDKAVSRLSDLQFASPSLSVTNAGETESVNIRGIGLSSNSPNVTNGVATYIDGLFQAQIVTDIPLYDIDGVEVLRGPQGTLVGNNSTGGAIFINSKDPSTSGIEGYAQATAGNYDRTGLEGAINLPLTSTLAVRAAGEYRNRDSYYTDIGPFHNQADKLDEKGGRLGLLWHPGRFQALLKLQIHDQDSGGFAYRPAPGTNFSAFTVGDPRTLSYDAPTSKSEKAFIGSLELRYEFAGGITLRSLTGYQYRRNEYYQDTDATQAPISPAGGFVVDYFARDKQYSEEINLISPTDSQFEWILGGYYQHNDIYVDLVQLTPPPNLFYQPRQDRYIYGIFGQGKYQLRDGLELQLGARYSHVKTDGTGSVRIGVGQPGFPQSGMTVADLSGAHKDSQVTGKAALNWNVDRNNLLYGFVARGYKPGGFNSPASEFAPETVWDYEFGWKSTMADGHLRTQIGGFYNDYKGLQLDLLDAATGGSAIQNVASATIKGIEAQVQAGFGGLRLDGGVSYVDSDLDSITFVDTRALPPGQLGPQCPTGVPPNPPLCFDYTPFFITTGGGPNLYSPKWTFNVGAEYRIEVENASLTPRVNYGYVGSRFDYPRYGPEDRLASRGLLSAQIMLAVDNWRIEVFGTNLTNKTYVSGRSADNNFYGAPREYGVRVGVNF